MNFSSFLPRRLRYAAPPLLAVLLTIALATTALAQQQPPSAPGGPPSNPSQNQPEANPPVDPPSSPPSNPPGTQQPGNQPAVDPPTNPPTNPTPNQPTNPTPNQPTNPTPNQPTNPPTNQPTTPQPHPSAPFTPPADCIISHAATPAQLCSMAGGLQYYFIGADGSAQPGPWIQPFSELATLGTASVYSGTNPKTGKSIQITYLASESRIRISTFYPDNEYDTNKPYNFTVDTDYNVTHEAW